MKACNEVLLDQQIVGKVLRTLTPLLITLLWQSKNPRIFDSMKVGELLNSLQAHEEWVKEGGNGERAQEQALQAQTIHKSKGVSHWNKKGKGKWMGGRSGEVCESSNSQTIHKSACRICVVPRILLPGPPHVGVFFETWQSCCPYIPWHFV